MKMYKNVAYTMPDGSVMYDIGQSVGYGSALKDLASEQEVLGDACDPSRKSEYAIAKFNGKLYAIQVR
jgi:hypothetical protein